MTFSDLAREMAFRVNGVSAAHSEPYPFNKHYFDRFRFKPAHDNSLCIREIRVSKEDGPSKQNGTFVLDVMFSGANDIHKGLLYEEPLLQFLQNHIIPKVHHYLIYNMHLWPRSFRKFIRANAQTFPSDELPFNQGDFIESNRSIYEVCWVVSNNDGKLYLAEPYKDKIKIFGARKVNVSHSKRTQSLQFEGNVIYFDLNQSENMMLVHRGRYRRRLLFEKMDNLIKETAIYKACFGQASRGLTTGRQGQRYQKIFKVPAFALESIASKNSLEPNRRSRAAPYEYTLEINEDSDEVLSIFGAKYWEKHRKDGDVLFVDELVLKFSVVLGKILVAGRIKRLGADGYVYS